MFGKGEKKREKKSGRTKKKKKKKKVGLTKFEKMNKIKDTSIDTFIPTLPA